MLAIVVAAGELHPSSRLLALVRAAGLVIAADGGARHLAALGRPPDLLIGDFDSLPPADIVGPEVMRFPIAKDQTDTHLAVREAVRRGARRVTILAALRGARLDHGAANLLLLSAAEFRRIDLRLADGRDELRVVRRQAELRGTAGDLVTLLAVTPSVRGVSTAGLAYPLRRETLARGDSRGVSNAMVGDEASVTVEHGLLLLVHRDGGDLPEP